MIGRWPSNQTYSVRMADRDAIFFQSRWDGGDSLSSLWYGFTALGVHTRERKEAQVAAKSASAWIWNKRWFTSIAHLASWTDILQIMLGPERTNWPCPDQTGLNHDTNCSPLVFSQADLSWRLLSPTRLHHLGANGAAHTLILSWNRPQKEVWVPADDDGWQAGFPRYD